MHVPRECIRKRRQRLACTFDQESDGHKDKGYDPHRLLAGEWRVDRFSLGTLRHRAGPNCLTLGTLSHNETLVIQSSSCSGPFNHGGRNSSLVQLMPVSSFRQLHSHGAVATPYSSNFLFSPIPDIPFYIQKPAPWVQRKHPVPFLVTYNFKLANQR